MSRDRNVGWDHGLKGPALNIARLDHTPMRVLAGPGTGKTFALMRRVARLLQTGTPADRILVSTFTRTAANDLGTALKKLDVEGATDVRTGTLHSFCFGLLASDDVLAATGRVPRPLLTFEERFLLEDVQRHDFGDFYDRQYRLRACNAAWARSQSQRPGSATDPVDQAFEQALHAWLLFHEAILIGELIPVSLEYLQENPWSPHLGVFEHVLVDEYQDLNRAEQDLLDLLAASSQFIVVGDEDQSIYSFKHAHPEGIATFHVSHLGTHDEQLQECRRCPKRVVAMANNLIANNLGRQPRVLSTRLENAEGEVHVLQWQNMDEEAQGIANIIRQRVQSREVEPGRVLVLAPRRQFGYKIRDALNNHEVLAHSFFHEQALDGDPKKLDQSSTQQAFALLTLLANPDDRVALRCWCGFGSSNLRYPAWGRLRTHCECCGESPWAALERMASGELKIPYTRQIVKRFRELQECLSALASLQGAALVEELFPEDCDWAEPIRSLVSDIKVDDFGAEELYNNLRTYITQPELPTDVDYVRVMSLHKSKGLTADLVIVVGCIEGLVPTHSDKPLSEQAALLEEQRRLFYVAVTRTRQTLILSSVRKLPRKLAYNMGVQVKKSQWNHVHTFASRFLKELGPSKPTSMRGSDFLKTVRL